MNIHESVKSWEQNQGVELFKDLNLNPNSIILDYGCGFGHYTFAASRALEGRGVVYSVDINKTCLRAVKETAQRENLSNIHVSLGNPNYKSNFDDLSLDMIMYYDLFHGNDTHRFVLLNEAKRTIKYNGILSVLPFHLSNFRDKNGVKKKYSYDMIIEEVSEFGFKKLDLPEKIGIHFEKYHSSHYIEKGGLTFDSLERGKILTFIKK